MIKDNTGEPRTSVSQRWQTSLLDLSKERLIFFQNTSDPQNISECGVFFLTDEWRNEFDELREYWRKKSMSAKLPSWQRIC